MYKAQSMTQRFDPDVYVYSHMGSLDRFSELFGTLDALKDEGERLKQVLSSLQSPLVFSHNDVQAKNLIYCSHKGMPHALCNSCTGSSY